MSSNSFIVEHTKYVYLPLVFPFDYSNIPRPAFLRLNNNTIHRTDIGSLCQYNQQKKIQYLSSSKWLTHSVLYFIYHAFTFRK